MIVIVLQVQVVVTKTQSVCSRFTHAFFSLFMLLVSFQIVQFVLNLIQFNDNSVNRWDFCIILFTGLSRIQSFSSMIRDVWWSYVSEYNLCMTFPSSFSYSDDHYRAALLTALSNTIVTGESLGDSMKPDGLNQEARTALEVSPFLICLIIILHILLLRF